MRKAPPMLFCYDDVGFLHHDGRITLALYDDQDEAALLRLEPEEADRLIDDIVEAMAEAGGAR